MKLEVAELISTLGAVRDSTCQREPRIRDAIEVD